MSENHCEEDYTLVFLCTQCRYTTPTRNHEKSLEYEFLMLK